MRSAMLRKIDCVMVRVDDMETAADYYARVFGLKEHWRDDTAVGMRFAETDAEIVLHRTAGIPSKVEVHYLVDDVSAAVEALETEGCRVLVRPFEIAIGKCAVIEDR